MSYSQPWFYKWSFGHTATSFHGHMVYSCSCPTEAELSGCSRHPVTCKASDTSCWALYFPFIFISWRLITLQYCSGFCHTLTWLCSFLKAPIRKLPQMNIFCGFKTKRIYFLRALEDRGLKSKCWQGHTPLEALWTILPCRSQVLMTLSVPRHPWLVATSLPSLPLYSITFSYTSPLLSKDTYYWT